MKTIYGVLIIVFMIHFENNLLLILIKKGLIKFKAK